MVTHLNAPRNARVPEVPALYSGNWNSGKESPLKIPETGFSGKREPPFMRSANINRQTAAGWGKSSLPPYTNHFIGAENA